MELTEKVCKHVWNFSITAMGHSNIFTETCIKCNSVISTLELFKDEN